MPIPGLEVRLSHDPESFYVPRDHIVYYDPTEITEKIVMGE